MSDEINEFKEWMDSRGLRTKDVAESLHVEEQTVRNWRSQGVPERRLPHVRKFMSEWEPTTPPSVEPISDAAVDDLATSPQNLVLYPTADQFDTWTAAFKYSNARTLKEWAMDGLNSIASGKARLPVKYPTADEEPLPYPRVAEDPTPYGQDKIAEGK